MSGQALPIFKHFQHVSDHESHGSWPTGPGPGGDLRTLGAADLGSHCSWATDPGSPGSWESRGAGPRHETASLGATDPGPGGAMLNPRPGAFKLDAET